MFIKFFNDIKSELGKISWIDKSENIKSTAGVVVVTIILMCNFAFNRFIIFKNYRIIFRWLLMSEKWYVVHVTTSFEDTVKRYIFEQMKLDNCPGLISDVLVPTETLEEQLKGGKKKKIEKIFSRLFVS